MLGQLAYEGALRRRDELQHEIDRCQRELDDVEMFLRLCARYAGMPDEMTTVVGPPQPQPSESIGEQQREPTVVSGMDLLPHIRAAMLEVGKPLKRGAIVRALEERGIRVGGEEPVRNIGTIMWRAKERGEFQALPGFGYWPAAVAYPPAGYEPHVAYPPAGYESPHDGETDEETPEQRRGSAESADETSYLWEQAAKGA